MTTERRIHARKRVIKAAFIAVSAKAPKLECMVRNISDTGAELQVSTTFGLPHTFDLIADGTNYKCRSVWRTDRKIGVAFEN